MKTLIFSFVLLQIFSGILCKLSSNSTVDEEVTKLGLQALSQLRGIRAQFAGCTNALAMSSAQILSVLLQGLQSLGVLSTSKLLALGGWVPLFGPRIHQLSDKLIICMNENNLDLTPYWTSMTTLCIMEPFNAIDNSIDSILKSMIKQLEEFRNSARNRSENAFGDLVKLASAESSEFLKILKSVLSIPVHIGGAAINIPTCIGKKIVWRTFPAALSAAMKVGSCILAKEGISRFI